MKSRRWLGAAAAMGTGLCCSLSQAATIADWTFETHNVPASPAQTGTTYTLAADVGTGTAVGGHASSATVWSSPAGNGSGHSFSANTWAVNDYYQFQVSTLGDTGVTLSWDQTSSNTGPKDFKLQYSTNGTTFTTLNSYSVLANATPNTPWSGSGSPNTAFSFSQDLTSLTALNNQASVYFRLVMADTVAAGSSSSLGTSGTDRVDNFLVSASPVPIPAGIWLLGSGLLSLAGLRRRACA